MSFEEDEFAPDIDRTVKKIHHTEKRPNGYILYVELNFYRAEMGSLAMKQELESGFELDFFGPAELGRSIKKVRALRGMTQEELALRTNTSTKFISNVENGKATAQLDKVLLIIRMLDIGTRLYDLRTRGKE